MPMKWDAEADNNLIEYFHQLAHLRAAHLVIWNGKRRLAALDEKHRTYAYICKNASEKVLVAINLGQEERTILVPTAGLESARDQLFDTGHEVEEGELKIVLGAHSGAFVCS